MKDNPRITKDNEPCPRCGCRKRWLPRGNSGNYAYFEKCTRCGWKK